MIQAIDLKVNNRFIREIHNSRGLEYDHNFVLTEDWMLRIFSGDTHMSLDHLFGIPLTPEILLKCGFTTDDSKVQYNIGLPIGEGADLFIEDEGHPSMSCGISSFPKNFNYFKDIRYLHELQNLFWCLCKKELEVNLH